VTDALKEKEAILQFLKELENDFALEAKAVPNGRKDLHYARCCKLIRELIEMDDHWIMPGCVPRYV